MKVIITGGAGFIGVNAAEHYAQRGDNVVLFDNLSRIGSEENLKWIKEKFPQIEFVKGDVRNAVESDRLFKNHSDVSLTLHLAAQVAVTTSVIAPREDFECNALGTFNILEGIRKQCPDCMVIYSSTNKVYGKMSDVRVVKKRNRYVFADLPQGVSEARELDFYSPYGCSKGCGDQYVHDYARIYGLHTAVFRQSCIYGYRQFGVEDQGWVAWFTIAAITCQPITVYGDGKQIRDILFIDDLVEAFDKVYENTGKTSGQTYNIGGGPDNSISLIELLARLEEFLGEKINVSYSDWRPGDQKVYISNIAKARKDFCWEPKISVKTGLKKIYDWVKENKEVILARRKWEK